MAKQTKRPAQSSAASASGRATSGDKHRCELRTSPERLASANLGAAAIALEFPAGLAKPALRALANAGYRTLADLSNVSEAEIRQLHGIGPNALEKLRTALGAIQLTFGT